MLPPRASVARRCKLLPVALVPALGMQSARDAACRPGGLTDGAGGKLLERSRLLRQLGVVHFGVVGRDRGIDPAHWAWALAVACGRGMRIHPSTRAAQAGLNPWSSGARGKWGRQVPSARN